MGRVYSLWLFLLVAAVAEADKVHQQTGRTTNKPSILPLLTPDEIEQRLGPQISRAGLSLFGRARSGQQGMQCWERPGRSGDSVRLHDYASDLGFYNFNDRAASCCVNGIWVLYEDYNYNRYYFDSAAYYLWGDDYCADLPRSIEGKASSARYIGPPDGYQFDTINFYQGQYFMGREEYFYVDTPQRNFDNMADSIVVTGCSPWTVYEDRNYRGSALCVYPSDTSQCTPGFYPTRSELDRLGGRVSSVRKGCHCRDDVHPRSLDMAHQRASEPSQQEE